MVVMSSANVTNFISFPLILIPLIWRLFGMEITNISRTMMKRIGESGSPWRTPRLTLKEGVKETIGNYAARYILISRLNPRYKGDTKTK